MNENKTLPKSLLDTIANTTRKRQEETIDLDDLGENDPISQSSVQPSAFVEFVAPMPSIPPPPIPFKQPTTRRSRTPSVSAHSDSIPSIHAEDFAYESGEESAMAETEADDGGSEGGGSSYGGTSAQSSRRSERRERRSRKHKRHHHSSSKHHQPKPVPKTHRERHDDGIKQSMHDFQDFKNSVNEYDEQLEKLELMHRLKAHEALGRLPLRRTTDATTLEELRYSLYRLDRDLERETTIKDMEKGLITTLDMLEMVNSFTNPIGARLTGFSRCVQMNMGSYRPSLYGIYAKYLNGRSFISDPIVALLFALVTSAARFHFDSVNEEQELLGNNLTDTAGFINDMAGTFRMNPFNKKKEPKIVEPPVFSDDDD